MFNLEEFLLMREKRVDIQNEIIKEFNQPILVLRANYPGEDKNNFVPKYIIEIIKDEVVEIFNSEILFSKKIESIEGPTYIYVIKNSGKEIKKIAMLIEENHDLGRCVDIDVFDSDGYAFSRKDFNGEKRKCLLCEEMAFVCARKKNHTQIEVQSAIQKKLELYLENQKITDSIVNTFSNLALKSVILEVSAFPSFGLVSPQSTGSHNDMDFFTFINSGFSLNTYFREVVKAGCSKLPIDLIFKKIRYMGKVAEKNMFLATNNVNTHKGLIFLMGITATCAAKAKSQNLTFENISIFIQEMCKDILKDFDNIHLKKTLTHGEKLFINHGIVGVRGVAKNGLDMVFNGGISIFKKSIANDEHINHAMIRTLIYLMSILEDTTILHRHDIEVLNQVKQTAIHLKEKFYDKPLNIEILTEIEQDFIGKRISPGGAADLLAITMFLAFIQNSFE
ncbi:MAG: citrate lyase holo-[acyl-carrier protein] synthase [Cetobacterium sp.]|uniref:citrate lyase holo-[acyl-carrier protein] synthase n=1 Tax=Cetobacterium sp. ZWU0022 TaxID=1340502 RepID=UPI0006462B03|nr:citrate lyase holo-[acyl-carrier protein] synthase [Cetobacterium sp. ZWU0022]